MNKNQAGLAFALSLFTTVNKKHNIYFLYFVNKKFLNTPSGLI